MRLRWPLLFVLASLAAIAPVSTDLYLPGFPDIRTDLDADASGVQLTLTAFLVGLSLGQLVMGPISDRFGRRRPLLISATVCVAAGVACAMSTSLAMLVVARLVAGVAGAGGMVIGRAVIADLLTGRAAARAFTLLFTVSGVAPVLAPLVGGVLAGPVGWRGMLWAVTAACVVMAVGVLVLLDETLSPQRRTVRGTPWLAAARAVLADTAFRGPAAVFMLSFAVMMSYIAASPFLYEEVVGLSAIWYGVVFGVNATGLIAAGWASSRLVDRFSPQVLVRRSVLVQLVAALAFLALAVTSAPTWTYPLPIFLVVITVGGIMGNAAGLAMAQVRDAAGTGSALLGAGQFALGAAVSPLVGLGGAASAIVPALVMSAAAGLGFLVSRVGLPGDDAAPHPASSSTSMATS